MTLAELLTVAGFVFTVLNGVVSYVTSRAGASAAIQVHLEYLRRDVEETRRSARAAHWRLDETGAPPAPTVHHG